MDLTNIKIQLEEREDISNKQQKQFKIDLDNNFKPVDKKEIIKRIVENKDLILIEQYKGYVELYDNENDKRLNINTNDDVNFDKVLEFSSKNINRKKLIEKLKLLPRDLFTCVEKILFINSVSELNLQDNQKKEHVENSSCIAVFDKNIIILNLGNIEREIQEVVKEISNEESKKEKLNMMFNTLIWVNIIYGLRIIMCNSKIYDNYEIHEKEKLYEDSMEIYANVIFNNILEDKDYICFK